MHCKKSSRISRPQPGCHLLDSPRTGIIKLFPARKGLVSDNPAGDGKTANLFLQCGLFWIQEEWVILDVRRVRKIILAIILE